MSAEDLYARHVELGWQALVAWFDDQKFRAAWPPEAELFVTDQQRIVAKLCASKGAGLDRDQAVYLLSRLDAWKKVTKDGAAAYELLEGRVVLDPWAALGQLREVAATRALRHRLQAALSDVDQGKGLHDVRSGLTEALSASAVGSGAKPRTIRQVMESAFVEVTNRKQEAGFRTISKSLDYATGGLRRKKVWVIAAGTSWGKSSFLVALESQLRSDGRRMLVVSGEDEEQLFGERWIGVETGADAIRMRDRKLLPYEITAGSNAIDRAGDSTLFIDVNDMPAEAVAADVRSICIANAIDVVAIDYLQVFRMLRKGEKDSRRDELWSIARLFKQTIKASNVAGIFFSQITEDDKTGKRKTRDAEDIEHLADVNAFGISKVEESLDAAGKKVGKLEKKSLYLKKVKNGPKGFNVQLNWDKESASFLSDYPRHQSDQPLEEAYS